MADEAENGLAPQAPAYRDPGEPPVLDWIDKGLIDIDPVYQRELDEGRVQRILDWFQWDNFGAVIVAPQDNGRYNCTDGGHRLEAAKRHPKVTVVPAILIRAVGVQAEAENFVAINRDRKNVNALQLYHASVAAGDPEAVTIKQVAERADVTILRYAGGTKASGEYHPRETIAIAALRSLVDKHGALRARQILDVLAKADLRPITGNQIAAAALLMTDSEYRDDVEPEALTASIAGTALILDDEANVFATTHRVTKAKALASCWFKRTRKKRKAQ